MRTYAFAEPSIKSAALGPFSLNALVVVRAEEGKFSRAAGGGFFWTQHLAPIGVFERDAAAVAERFLGAPYLWGGRTSVGLDCSGLVQQSLYACGRSCPRDADQQAALGREIGRAELARGDLVCWRGHIGLMLDEVKSQRFRPPTATASRMMMPRAMSCWLYSSPMRMRPLLLSPIISAPTMEPITVPRPPKRLVPPRTAAAITESSSPSPTWKRPECSRPA